ncbi:MAG TPA: hypothetical protein VK497_00380 [Candidatus Saccharimonadales bacterium]|nr:hypothetical protein [Candidatus Saccharimonadales bacterium]
MSERLVLLNAGYSTHKPKKGDIPSNEGKILDFIASQRKDENDENDPGSTTFVLIDTIWSNRFGENDPDTGENKSLASHLGLRAAFTTLIDDDEYANNEWKSQINVTIGTDHQVAMENGKPLSQIVRLGEGKEKARNALITTLEFKSALGSNAVKLLKLAAVYPPETDPHAQMRHISGLNTALNGEGIIPRPSGYQIVAGDLNGLDEHARYKPGLPKLGSKLVELWAKKAERSTDPSYWDKVALTLDKRLVIPKMRSFRYLEAGAGSTFHSRASILDLDRIHYYGLRKKGAKTVGKGLSDHRAVVFDFDLL